jgi:hypothetical protein
MISTVSINFSDRVLFKFSDPDAVDLINIGDHSTFIAFREFSKGDKAL